MKIMICNCSPKKEGGASVFFSKILKFFLFSGSVIVKRVSLSLNYEDTFCNLDDIDALVLSVPLYVDSIPSHLIPFLKKLEIFCKEKKCNFRLYVISNSGFTGGHQNKPHIEQYKCFCERSGIKWGGGLGIGGAVMLQAVFYAILSWSLIQFIIGVIVNLVYGRQAIDTALIAGFSHTIFWWFFLLSGMFLYLFIFARAVKRKKSIKNLYTRVMVPSFIFLIVADIFMVFQIFLKKKSGKKSKNLRHRRKQ